MRYLLLAVVLVGVTAFSNGRFVAAKPQQKSTLKGHNDLVWCSAFRLDGKMLASGCKDGAVGLWDLATGEEKSAFQMKHKGPITSVVWSPNGKTIATASADKTIKLWDTATFKNIATLNGHAASVHSVAFSPDGKTLASGTVDMTVELWDVATAKGFLTFDVQPDEIHSVHFSPDGKNLVSSSGGMTINVTDVATGKSTMALTKPAGAATIGTIVLGPDGKTLAMSYRRDAGEEVCLWNTNTDRFVYLIAKPWKGNVSFSFSPDGTTLAVAGPSDFDPPQRTKHNAVTLYDTATGKQTNKIYQDGVGRAVAFSPDGKMLALPTGKTILLMKI